MYNIMNVAMDKQKPANRNIVPWKPSVSFKSGKNLTITNANIDIVTMQSDVPKFLIFSGKISAMTMNGKLSTAHDAIKITNEKLAIGIKFNVSTWTPQDFNIM